MSPKTLGDMCTISKEVLEGESIVIYTASGVLNADCLAKKVKLHAVDHPTKHAIWDFLNSSISNLSNQELDKILNVSIDSKEKLIVCAVVSEELSKMIYKLYVDKAKLKQVKKEFYSAPSIDSALSLIRENMNKSTE